MVHLVTCIALLFVTTGFAQGTLSKLPKGLTIHKGSVTWEEARDQCHTEGGVLASPVNTTTLAAMTSVVGVHDVTYFIGTKATDLPGQFVSVEGVALENMPLTVILDMVQQLDQREGDCLAMSRDGIRAVPCWSKLPYMCYGTHVPNTHEIVSNCGPDEKGYKYDTPTGHCYKLHTDPRTWKEALSTCLFEGGHLAVIENEEEAQIIKNMETFTYDPYIFIGRLKKEDKTGWMSIYGQPVEELYNDVTEDAGLTSNSMLCGGLNKSGKWRAVRCEARGHFICQKEPTM